MKQFLNSHMKLRIKRNKAAETLDNLRMLALPASPGLDDMPHGTEVKDKVGDLAIEIHDLEARVRGYDEIINSQEPEVTAYIAGIENPTTAIIFKLRFLRCASWRAIAGIIGGGNTADGIKKICYRQFDTPRKGETN